ncbi:hypothetical protein DXX93_17100 [Thalassotalea euphylliae]|uniref:DUF6351 domain-containing protein n=2 Tax=Thalassotalea euphylliae TaxID=1655234 RepID=A0A3E0TUI4_9GAMM|nr:hypothetical protein DXX93_17100 [Thalassotalea euphylliae]
MHLASEHTSAKILDFSTHIRFSARPKETFPFPIKLGEFGPINTLYAGAPQYPFYCMTLDSGLGQPHVDNQAGWGVAVYEQQANPDKKQQVIGYSKDCAIPTTISYAAVFGNGEIKLFKHLPATDISQSAKQLFQLETGTINRFLYLLIMPVSQWSREQVNPHHTWNNKLIYQFEGGSGIGFRQGKLRIKRTIERRIEQLSLGYAVITSTANKTSHTYNMLLAEDTARRVKHQFVSLYGKPEYTVGIGGSGGALAQYLIGQNSNGLLDAAIPLYSYPDMISQTLYALDCDLLNNYYAFRSQTPEFWRHWPNRILLEGMNARNGDTHVSAVLEPINQVLAGRWPRPPQGNSECINGWFGLSTFIHNPAQGFLNEYFADTVAEQVQWSYWQDMVELFGHDELGFANHTWGNQGVQYGLLALRQRQLSAQQFIDINWHIGSWKPLAEMAPERFIGGWRGKKGILWLTLWSRHNITQATTDKPAKRLAGSDQAAAMAYRSGQIFIGDIDLPIIDVRHYLEDELDMHHMSASFVTRLRITQALGHARHQIIWVADKNYQPEVRAFAAMDRWLQQRRANPELSAWQTKPADIVDACFDHQGQVIASGDKVWHGNWNQQTAGACAQHFESFSNSRIAAGGPWAGNIFRCKLMPVEQAIAQGVYGDIDMQPHLTKLNAIFPTGVCDYRYPDQARPTNL